MQSLAHEPSGAERVLIEHTAILDVRVRALRAWGQHTEADAVTVILMKSLGELHKMRPSLLTASVWLAPITARSSASPASPCVAVHCPIPRSGNAFLVQPVRNGPRRRCAGGLALSLAAA